MFDRIFIEKRVLSNPYAKNILRQFNEKSPIVIDRLSDIFEKTRKPYLHKRTNLDIFIGKKEGMLLKEAVSTYGFSQFKHYYFVNSYNCIYECQYCYLQGYFNSPDLVFFVNHEEVLEEMKRIIHGNKDQVVWFHGGEFSDNLALSHYTLEWEDYFNFFESHPNAKLELRTKSINIRAVENLKPLANVFISFSLSSEEAVRSFDLKTPSLGERLKAMKKLAEKGFSLGVHFDPIISSPHFLEDYASLVKNLFEQVPINSIIYISLGVVRFSKNSFKSMKENYPESLILNERFLGGEGEKFSYSEFKRNWILRNVRNLLTAEGYDGQRIYWCMEENEQEDDS